MQAKRFLLLLLTGFSLLTPAFASPSVFPENALFAKAGYNGTLILSAGGELVLDIPYFDTSVGVEAYLDTASDTNYGVRVDGSALVFPALGTTPPLAFGVGADVDVNNKSTAAHVGVILGTDLLFVFDVPVTLSAYLAPGYDTQAGFSPAWAFQIRYYFDTVAIELASTDVLPVSLGVRFLF